MDKNLFSQYGNENFLSSRESLRAFMMIDVNAQSNSKSKIVSYSENIATISIKGMMLREKSIWTNAGLATSTEEVLEEIKSALDKGMNVDLVIDSGGGVVSGVSVLADYIHENRDRINTFGKGTVASGAMWVFSAGGNRYAEDTTLLGSIGVVSTVYDDSKYWEEQGIILRDVVSDNAKNKRPDYKTSEGIGALKATLTQVEEIFIDAVMRNLGMNKIEVIENFNRGGMITGKQAMKINAITDLVSQDKKTSERKKMSEDLLKQLSALSEEVGAFKAKEATYEVTLKEKDGTISALEEKNKELLAQMEELKATHEDGSTVKTEEVKEIVAMAFKKGLKVDTTLEILEKPKTEAFATILELESSIGAESDGGDFEGGEVDELKAHYEAKRKARLNV